MIEVCSECGMKMQASKEIMNDILDSHHEEVDGISQCEKNQQGLLGCMKWH